MRWKYDSGRGRKWSRSAVISYSRCHSSRSSVAALDDLDAGLLGLLDVAPPQLVEVLVDLFQRAVRQRDLEDVAGLYVAEAGAAVLALLPAHPAQLVGDLEGARLDEVGLDVAQPLDVRVLDAAP